MMNYWMEELSRSSKIASRLANLRKADELKILSDDKEKLYYCFSTSYLFKDLFQGGVRKGEYLPPLIRLPETPKSHRAILAFILPPDILRDVETQKKADGTLYIKADGSNNDYKGFLEFTVNNNKIRDALHDLFVRLGWKSFTQTVREHWARQLRSVDLSDNPELHRYLRSIGDRVIVPRHISDAANDAFHALLDAGDHDSVSQIIANFFLSCLLGLRALKYAVTNYAKPYKQTYLLSKLGMECIWTPERITPPYHHLDRIRRLYENGHYKAAFEQVDQWMAEHAGAASKEDLAAVYQIRGVCLYHHPERFVLSASDKETIRRKQADGVAYLETGAATDAAKPEVYHLLYEIFRESDPAKAVGYLRTAFTQTYPKAVSEAADLFLSGVRVFDDLTEAQLLQKLDYIIQNEQMYADSDLAKCLYLRGCFAKQHGNDAEAGTDFADAAAKGSERARQECSRSKRMERQTFPSFVYGPDKPCCFVNSLNGNNLAVLSTFPDAQWSVYTAAHPADNVPVQTVRDIDAFLAGRHFGTEDDICPKTVFLFMSENEDNNINECLILLDKLFNLALGAAKPQQEAMIDRIDIYVGARFEMASMLIDANISDMGSDIYFKVHITDETRDAVHRTLCDAPLFLPFLNPVEQADAAHIVLLGSSEMQYRFIKESIACAYMGDARPVTVTLLGEHAAALESRLRQECPGMFNNPHIACIRPEFIPCDIRTADFPSYIYGSQNEKDPDNQIVRVLSEGNYFVVDYAEDLENIRFAMALRTWLLRSRGTFDRAPFIAVRCANEQNSYLAGHLSLSGQAAGNAYYNSYNLFPIGGSGQLYSYRNLIERPILHDVALRIHKSYYGDNERLAENDFYSYSYNLDSSLLTAIGLCYRFFCANAVFRDKTQYLHFGALDRPELLSEFENSLRRKEIIMSLGALEQSRWVGFMLSRGWEPAGSTQVRAYKSQSSGSSHKHTLAKLHPFIREWDDLESPELLQILNILQSRFHYNRRPQQTTISSIQNTARFILPSDDKENEPAR